MTAAPDTPRIPLSRRTTLPLAQPSAPPFPLVGAHFALGYLWAVAGALLLVILAPALATGAFLDPKLIALTHFFALGWMATIITGVLYQIFPAMLGIGARSVQVAWWTLAVHTAGAVSLVAGLRWGHPLLQVAGWCLLSAAVYASAWNLLPQRRRAPRNRQIGIFISYAHMGFGFALVLAGARVGDVLGWWSTPRLPILAAHFHFAAVGFATMTAFGVGSRMLPMFLGSTEIPALPLRWLPRILATGTVLFAAGALADLELLKWAGAAGMVAGAGIFLWFGLRRYRGRPRVPLDPAAAFLLGALLWLILAIPLGLDALARGQTRPGVITSYAVVLLLGWLTSLTLGVSFKVLPNLAWYYRFAATAGQPGAPSPLSLLQPVLGWVAVASHTLGLLVLVGGLHRSDPRLAVAGSFLVAVGVLAAAAHHLRLMLVGRTA